MSDLKDFVIEDGNLKKYVGEGVTSIAWAAFSH